MKNDEIDAIGETKIHLLDVGAEEYGDSLLCQFGSRTVLIDGAHPGDDNGSPGHDSIPKQIGSLLNSAEPYPIDLLVITHAHLDHIGCIPNLIADGKLKVKWALIADPGFGWGRADGEDRDSGEDERTLTISAALREEIRTAKGTDDRAIEMFLTDAVTLESKYKKMIGDLVQQGTEVVRFGRDNPDKLVKAFKTIGLKLIGPSADHLIICADIINKKTTDSISRVSDLFRKDANTSAVSAYRELAAQDIDNATGEAGFIDAKSRPGPAINLQSIITQFKFGGHKFLFGGDFQFALPQVNSADLVKSVSDIRKSISNEAPYSFVKLSHHGSDNGFSADILDDLKGSKLLGLCAGEHSTHHPHRKVLELLDKHRNDLTWTRTDHNRLVTMTFKQGTAEPQIKLSQGALNDAKPNDTDIVAGAKGRAQTPVMPIKPPPLPVNESAAKAVAPAFIEVHAKIPVSGARIRFSGDFTIEVDSPTGVEAEPVPGKAGKDSSILIGGGRAIVKNLLFVTSRDALRENIGQLETDEILAAFASQNVPLFADVPKGQTNSNQSASLVSSTLRQYQDIRGVVILGGYDVVPAQILDCLPTALRSSLPFNDDPDDFIVWSDDVYGDTDGDGLPEIPVSRIPDGKSASLVFKALQAVPGSPGNRRFGIRNVARPFASGVFETLTGSDDLLVSRDTVFDQSPPYSLAGEKAYFMLHGDYVDGSRFWGEGTQSNREAINVNNLPDEFAGVVFAGCCWGALTVNTPAGLVRANRAFGQKTLDSSIALSFLARGANAFVGCTGAHYSPTEAPYDYFGGPMHISFWRNINENLAPAEALFRAKTEYVAQMPHGRTSSLQMAIEYKILRQYTCLGLGW